MQYTSIFLIYIYTYINRFLRYIELRGALEKKIYIRNILIKPFGGPTKHV